MDNTKQITPIIDQLYWKVSGDEYQLIRQTQANETVFFIATQAEYEAITDAANYEAARVEDAKRIDALVAERDALKAYIRTICSIPLVQEASKRIDECGYANPITDALKLA